jgi:hypothetical protein
MNLSANNKESESSAGIPDSRSLTESFSSKRQEMRTVIKLTKTIVQSHPDDFIVDFMENDILSTLHVASAFESQGSPLRLYFGITKRRNGAVTHEINIRPEHGSWRDGDVISYRLDVSLGREAQEHYDRIIEASKLPADTDKDVRFKRTLTEFMLSYLDITDDGNLMLYADNYAETTIRTEEAIRVLSMGHAFRCPCVSGSSLREFREWAEEQKAKGSGLAGLLE